MAEAEQGVDLDPTTPRYFSEDNADTSKDPTSGALGETRGASPFIATRVSWAEGHPHTFYPTIGKGGRVQVSGGTEGDATVQY